MSKILKKLPLALLVLLLTFSMVACQSDTPAEEPTETPAEAEDGPLTVGFAQSGNPNPWMVALTESMEDEAGKRGVNYIYTDANDDMATHVANIEDMLEKDLDYLVIAPMENTGLESVLEKAAEKGVPVILTGRTTTGDYVTTVYSDQAWEGERSAEVIGAVKPDAKVVELRGIEGTSSVAGREKGFREVMAAQFPEMEIIAEQTANFLRSEAMNVMTNIIQAEGAENIDAVFAHNDEMGIGAIQAIKDAGLVPGEDILVVSIDGQKEALDAVIAGEMIATVQCSPKHGPTVFDVIAKLENGESVEKETIIPDQVITIENADEAGDLVF